MTVKPFVWNFSLKLDNDQTLETLNLASFEKDPNLKWERRFFWPETESIIIQGLPESFLNFDDYRFKKRKDCYILNVPNHRNVKIRNKKIANKPLIVEQNNLFGYAKKQKYPFESQDIQTIIPELKQWDTKTPIETFLGDYYSLVPTYKEAFIYDLNPDLKALIEFTRIKLGTDHYFSFCIEAKNKTLVETLSQIIIPNHTAKDYLQFIEEAKL